MAIRVASKELRIDLFKRGPSDLTTLIAHFSFLSYKPRPRDEMADEGVWPHALNERTGTIVKLREGIEPPLIIVHGGGGSIHAFVPLKRAFTTPLWAIQVTQDTPRTSLEARINFYYQKIVEHQPHGPYRIASFSATSIIAVGIVKNLENDGREVEQLAFIDHFPTTFLIPTLGVDISRIPLNDPRARTAFLNASIDNLLCITRADMKGRNPSRTQLADSIEAAYKGLEVPHSVMEYKAEVDHFLNSVFDFMLSLQRCHSDSRSDPSSTEFMEKWMRSVRRAPVSVYLATYGMLHTYTPGQHPPDEWRIRNSFENVRVCILEAGHFDILKNPALHRGLQEKYLSPEFLSRL